MQEKSNIKRSFFPDDFIFGTATSAYQIEGHAAGGAGRTHWDDFAETPNNVVNAETGAVACDHLHRLEEDLDWLEKLGVDAYRFSFSWARILPEGTGVVNQAGIDFYQRLIDGLLKRNIQPFATLYHWELPSVLADKGGWRNADIAKWFADYAAVVGHYFGDRLASIATINEPWCVGWLSHFEGVHAPGLRDIRATARAMHHILVAHGSALQALRAENAQQLGVVFNMEWPQAASESMADIAASQLFDAYYNRFFTDGIFKGEYPESLLTKFEPHLPVGWQDDFAVIQTPNDWVGLNYYTRSIIAANNKAWPAHHRVQGSLEKTDMGWEIYPEGLYHFLRRLVDDYECRLPIFITENGMASRTIGNDQDRIHYIHQHLSQVLKAIDEGVPVVGYFVWSLMDNFEWALGYDKRFGLLHVDFDTLKRTPKASFRDFAERFGR